jgi:hypothetical protein
VKVGQLLILIAALWFFVPQRVPKLVLLGLLLIIAS